MGNINAEKKTVKLHNFRKSILNLSASTGTVLWSLWKLVWEPNGKNSRASRAILYIPWCLRNIRLDVRLWHTSHHLAIIRTMWHTRVGSVQSFSDPEKETRPCYVVTPVEKVIEWVYFLSKVFRAVNVHRKTRENITEMGENCQYVTFTLNSFFAALPRKSSFSRR